MNLCIYIPHLKIPNSHERKVEDCWQFCMTHPSSLCTPPVSQSGMAMTPIARVVVAAAVMAMSGAAQGSPLDGLVGKIKHIIVLMEENR